MWYIHHTCTNCSSWHDLLMPRGVCVLDLHFTLEWPWLGRNGYIYITVPRCDTFTKLAPTIHLDMIYWYHMVVCFLDLHFTLEWPWLERNGYVYITIPRCDYFHQTCTNCSSWHDLLIPDGGVCPWPTLHTWVTMVKKKWLSLYYSTFEYFWIRTIRNKDYIFGMHTLLMMFFQNYVTLTVTFMLK